MHKLFCFNEEEIFIFFISMLSGFPSSGKYSSYLYKKKLISKESAERMLMCSHFSNPLFVFGTVFSLIQNKRLCILILLSHYLGNFVIAFFTRDNQRKKQNKNNRIVLKKESFIDALTSSISNNTTTLLFILSSVSLFFIISSVIKKLFHFNLFFSVLISGILEMTQGIKMVSLSNYSLSLVSILITFFISFGGISIHLQTLGMISDTDLSYKSFFKGRIFHSILSIIFIILLIYLYK